MWFGRLVFGRREELSSRLLLGRGRGVPFLRVGSGGCRVLMVGNSSSWIVRGRLDR